MRALPSNTRSLSHCFLKLILGTRKKTTQKVVLISFAKPHKPLVSHSCVAYPVYEKNQQPIILRHFYLHDISENDRCHSKSPAFSFPKHHRTSAIHPQLQSVRLCRKRSSAEPQIGVCIPVMLIYF